MSDSQPLQGYSIAQVGVPGLQLDARAAAAPGITGAGTAVAPGCRAGDGHVDGTNLAFLTKVTVSHGGLGAVGTMA